MAKLQQPFDATQVPPSSVQEVIPAGWYPARIEESEWAETSKKDGWMLKFKLVIIGGEHADHVLFDRLNMQNPNVMAMEIAQKTLSSICHATKVFQLEDTAQLHGIPLMIKVALRPAGPGADGKNYEASNEIKGYKEVERPQQAQPAGFVPSALPTAPAPTPAPAAFAPPAAAAPAAAPFAPAPTPAPAASAGGKPPWAK